MTEPFEKKSSTLTHWGAFDLEVSGNRVTRTRGIEADPDPSPIGRSLAETTSDNCRIRYPVVRKSYLENGPGKARLMRGREPFVRVSWEDAECLVANELRRVMDNYGNSAIYGGSYGWASAGRFHHAQSQIHRFLNSIGGYTRSCDTYSLAAGEVILPHVIGESWGYIVRPTSWANIVAHSELVVAFGGLPLKNAQVNAGGTERHVQRGHIEDAVRAGIEFVNISPMRSDIAKFANAKWICPRPNTDVAIMLGIAHTLLKTKRFDEEFLQHYCVGHEAFFDYLCGANSGQPKDAIWAGRLADIDPDEIVDLAQGMASKRTMISVSWSLTRQDHGEQPYWMAVVLAAMLGQIGLPGGGVGFGYAAENKIGAEATNIRLGSFPGLPRQIESFIPVARVADMLLHPGAQFDYNGSQYTYPDIKLVYWAGGNPFHHHQDLNRLHRAWQRPDTIVSHEIWWNSTARHADIVLPVTSPLERDDIGGASGGTWIQAMPKAVEPTGEARNDFDIFSALSRKLGSEEAFTEGRSKSDWLRQIYSQTRENATAEGIEMPEFDDFWRLGSFTFPASRVSHVMMADFRRDPEANPLKTPSGKIEIQSSVIESFAYSDCPGHPSWLEPVEWLGSSLAETFPLHLISNQPATRLHSQLDNGVVSRESKIRGREPIWINSADAASRGVKSGDVVIVRNNRGAFLAGAVTSSDIRPGVVQIATGAWWEPVFDEAGQALCIHGNPNTVTIDKGTSSLAQGPSAMSCLVELELFVGNLPTVRSFDAPIILDSIDT